MECSIDHLGIAVRSLASAKEIYEKLGLSVSREETVEQEQVKVVMVPVGESRLPRIRLSPSSSPSAARDCTMFAFELRIWLRRSSG
jgi:hypothetical protein